MQLYRPSCDSLLVSQIRWKFARSDLFKFSGFFGVFDVAKFKEKDFFTTFFVPEIVSETGRRISCDDSLLGSLRFVFLKMQRCSREMGNGVCLI